MSRNLRSLLIVLSLVFILLGGILIPDTAQAQDENTTQQTKSITWKASRENATQFHSLVEEMGIQAKVTNARDAKELRTPSGMQLSDREVNADEMAKLVETNINHDEEQQRTIYIDIYFFDDGSVLIIVTIE